MGFIGYTKIHRLNKTECEGLLCGTVYVTPKLDGTNASIWADENGNIHCGSRTREITPEKDNAGFAAWVYSDGEEQHKLSRMLVEHTEWHVFGEWLGNNKFVGHIKTYEKNSLKHFWIFDIYSSDLERYLTWEEMTAALYLYNLSEYCIPLLDTLVNPSMEDIKAIAEKNDFLLNSGAGEGVVCKNYNFMNRFGVKTYGKYILEHDNKNKDGNHHSMYDIVSEYLLDSELEKIAAKLSDVDKNNLNKYIGMFVNYCWHDFLTENIVDICKKHKNPVLDMKEMNIALKAICRDFIFNME